MEKIKNIKIEQLLYIAMFIPTLYFLKSLNNDFYFLYKHGEYVINNGFPITDCFSMHSDSAFVMQQWLSAVIYYLIYEYLGKVSLFIFITFIAMISSYYTYKTFYLVSTNKILSSLLTFISSFVMVFYTQTRPFTITYLLTIILLYTLIKYTKTNNKKLLLILPVLSLIQINIQSSMWIFLLIMILPFIFERKLFTSKNIYCDLYDKLPLYLSILAMIFTAFINPYGIDAIFYVFRSIKYNELLFIYEMSPASLTNIGGILIILVIIMFTILMINHNGKANIRYIFFFWGSIILTFFALRNVPYLGLAFCMLLADLLKNTDIGQYFKKDLEKSKRHIIIILTCTIFVGIYLSITDLYKIEKYNAYEGIDYIVETYGIDDNTTIYTDYNDGSYAMFKGFKVYLDARMEVYLKSNTKQLDYIDEYCYLQHGRILPNDFLEKYKFDYLILSCQDIMYKSLNNDEYKLIYENEYCQIYKKEEV